MKQSRVGGAYEVAPVVRTPVLEDRAAALPKADACAHLRVRLSHRPAIRHRLPIRTVRDFTQQAYSLPGDRWRPACRRFLSQ